MYDKRENTPSDSGITSWLYLVAGHDLRTAKWGLGVLMCALLGFFGYRQGPWPVQHDVPF